MHGILDVLSVFHNKICIYYNFICTTNNEIPLTWSNKIIQKMNKATGGSKNIFQMYIEYA